MTSDVLSSGGAKVSTDDKGLPAVALSIKDKDTFYKVTKKVSQTSDKLLVIWLDYKDTDSYAKELAEKQAAPVKEKDKYGCGSTESRCLSAATVEQGFASDVIIKGSFTEEEVENLVTLINSGSLPTKLTEISSKTVDASFGADSLELTAKAGIIGVGLIMLVMIITYHFAGFISAIGLLFSLILLI